MTAAPFGVFRLLAIMDDYYDKVISFKELYKGLKKSCRNVRWKDSVAGYESNGLKNTLKLRNELLSGKYKIMKYQIFTIHEPKERIIVATRLKDRQFQRSLCECGLYEDITEHLIRDNCACLRGRGVDDALHRMKVHLRRFYNKHGKEGWVLKCDIHHFFGETDHNIACSVIDKYVSDKRAGNAVKEIINSFDGDKGVGLGSQISQLVELLVLNDIDHFIKERLRIKHYIRYMDDFILIHEDKEHLKYCKSEIENQLQEIGLKLNKKTSLFPLKQGIWFLKWRFVIVDSGKIIMLMDKKKIYRQRKRLRKLLEKESKGKVSKGTAETSLMCWLANAKRGNTYKIQNEMVEYFNRIQEEQNG